MSKLDFAWHTFTARSRGVRRFSPIGFGGVQGSADRSHGTARPLAVRGVVEKMKADPYKTLDAGAEEIYLDRKLVFNRRVSLMFDPSDLRFRNWLATREPGIYPDPRGLAP